MASTTPSTTLTPEDIRRILDHVNADHLPELRLCVQAFSDLIRDENTTVTATDLSETSVTFLVNNADREETLVLHYAACDSAPDIRSLVGAARKKLGLKDPKETQTWQVGSVEERAGFQRLSVTMHADLPDWNTGYAKRFFIDPETTRTYTLRRVDGREAVVDIFLRPKASRGNAWAAALQTPTEVTVMGGCPEKLPDFSQGAVLLMGDETALPTLAALLETWSHEHELRILIEVSDAATQRYLDDVCLPRHCHISWLPRVGAVGNSLLSALEGLERLPTVAWGALESAGAKRLQTALTEEYGLAPEYVRVVGYWKAANGDDV